MITTARTRASYISISMFSCALALGCAGTVEDGTTKDDQSSLDPLCNPTRRPGTMTPAPSATIPVNVNVPSAPSGEPAGANGESPSPEPETPSPEPETPSPEPETETPEAEPAAPSPEPETETPEATPPEEVGSMPMPIAPAPAPQCPDVGLDASKVYYVCDCQSGAASSCKAGNDSAAGTQSAPFKTYERARQAFADLDAGQTVAFCRGGSFEIEGDRRWVNAKCKKDKPCVVRDYGAQTLEKPILTANDGDGFAFEDGANADHEEGYTFLNLDLRSTSGGEDGNGFFVYNDIDDVLVCGASISGFGIGFHSAGSNEPAAGSDGKNSRVVLSNSTIKNNGNQGYLGGGDGCGVQYSTFENNGFNETVLNHNIYFSPRGADGMFALHNDLHRSAIVDGKCEGVSLVVHGQLTNLRIEGNNVHEDIGAAGDGCWGITVDTGYAGESEGFKNVQIRGNTVTNVGNLGIGLNACQDCVIENNVVIQEQAIESTLISAPNRERQDIDQEHGKVTVRNNTLFARSSSKVTGIALGGEATGHVVVSNALLSKGAGQFDCFSYDLADQNYGARDNNLCHATAKSSWLDGATLASFRDNAAADLASVDLDPLFASTTAPYDFTPKAGSPLLDAGHSLSAVSDLEGHSRGAKPDIGAIER